MKKTTGWFVSFEEFSHIDRSVGVEAVSDRSV